MNWIVIQVKKINNFIKNLQKKIRKHLGYQQQHKLFSLGSVKPAIGQEWFVAVSKRTAVNTIVERQDKMPGDEARARVRLSCDELHFLALLELNFIYREIILLLSPDLLLTFNSHTQMHGE